MSDSDEEDPVVVLDNGSSRLRAGFAGNDCPSVVIPSMVGRCKYKDTDTTDKSNRQTFIGDEAQEKREILSLSYPIQHGTITNWDDMETLWRYALHKRLGVDAEDMKPVLCSDAPLTCKAQREMMTQTMFESINVPAFFIVSDDILAKYASGRVSDIMIGCGDGVTSVVPHYEGTTSPNAYQRIDVAGSDVTGYLASLLSQRGYSFTSHNELEIVRNIKEQLCYVAEDYDLELNNAQGYIGRRDGITYELPSGETINLGFARFQAMEALFKPSLMGFPNLPGIHEMAYEAWKASDIDQRADLACNFILSGGSTLCPGFKERMKKELRKLIPQNLRMNVIAFPERGYFPWIGGSIMGSLTTFQDCVIKREDYDEYGPTVIHRCARLGMV